MSVKTIEKVRQHYQDFLAEHYSWLAGGYEKGIQDNLSFFQSHNIVPLKSEIAIDLGAGCGFQSVALASLGFEVKAVDYNQHLLDELHDYLIDKEYEVDFIHSDILDFNSWENYEPELIVCMGDTLTHLPDIFTVGDFILSCYQELIHGGKLALSYRDYTDELFFDKRFHLVKSDDGRLFNCFIEYHTDYVTVYDILYHKNGNGWEQKISSYDKVKLSINLLKSMLLSAGFEILDLEKSGGLTYIVAEKI